MGKTTLVQEKYKTFLLKEILFFFYQFEIP